MATIENYYNALFDPGEATCFAWTATAASVASLCHWEDQRSPWICVNPLHLERDNDPEASILPWARNDRGRRADCNVSAFRNILVEMDSVPLAEQWTVIRDCGMPFTTSVYSGGKSIHFVISLSDPCANRTE